MTEGKWRSWVVRCEAVRWSASQTRGREACPRSADPATGAPGPLRPGRAVQGATAARCTLASVTPGTRETLARLKGWPRAISRVHRLAHCLRAVSGCGRAKAILAPAFLQSRAEVAVTSRAQATWPQSGRAPEHGEGTKKEGREVDRFHSDGLISSP